MKKYEDEAYERLMKRPAAMNTPAAAVMKRPAACTAAEGVVKKIKYATKWEDAGTTSTKNAFASRHYGRATTVCKHQCPGISNADLKATIQKVYQDAAALWSKKLG